MNDNMNLLGLDSLGRNLDEIVMESLLRSLIFGVSVSVLILLLLVFFLFIWFRLHFSKNLTRYVIIADHIVPKTLILIMLSVNSTEHKTLLLLFGIVIVLLPSFFSQMMIQINSKIHPDLKNYYLTKSNYTILFFYEIIPLVSSLLILNFFNAVIHSILLETVLTHLGIGMEFGTPSIGFLLSDGFSNFYHNKVELIIALVTIILIALSGALISNKVSK